MTTGKQNTALVGLILNTIIMTSSFAEKGTETTLSNIATNKTALSNKQVEEKAMEEEQPDADFLEFLAGMDDASDDEFDAWLKTPKAADKLVNETQTEKKD